MVRNCCHVSLAFVLKLLNFLQAFLGVSIVVYSIWMLDQWGHHVPISPPPFPAPSPHYSSSSGRLSNSLDYGNSVFGFMFGLGFDLDSLRLPAPWFIYSFMGVGILLCCITLIGCMAAESMHRCCLCSYTILKTVLILLEVALVAFIALDHHWEKDLPFDPTGELDSLRSFIENNVYICNWVGITVITIQALSLLLAMVLQGMVSPRRTDLEEEEDYENVKGRTREPLLNQASQTSRAGTYSDIWSSRMREKYGLNSGEKSSLLNQNASVSMKTK